MKVFVAGATGALGKQLVPQLVSRGHEVIGMTRTPSKSDLVRSLGARPVVADALDPDAVGGAVSAAEPDVIVHQLTALSSIDLRHIERDFALTDRLRTEGTDHLLSAGQAVGLQRFVAQSFAGWPFARSGGPIKAEDDPLDPNPPKALRRTLDAIRHVESVVPAATWTEGVVLRYGGFYGPGTGLSGGSPPGEQAELLLKRKWPLIGNGGGVWSFIHITDAAAATVAAVEHGTRGIYNVVDDEPAPVSEWLPAAAAAVGAKPPMRVPRWIGRLMAGEAATVMMTEVRGASNAKAKRELGWSPAYPSWRKGFSNGLG
jgi:nucleoside-diphosphate-sugar epimerase